MPFILPIFRLGSVLQLESEPAVEQIGKAPEDMPFAIPKKWKWIKFSQVLTLENGDRGENYPAKSKLTRTNTGHPFVSAANLENSKISEKNLLFMTQEQCFRLRSGHIKKGDCLFCIRGSLGKFGFAISDGGAIASSLVILRPKNEIFQDYLIAWIKSDQFKKLISTYSNGSAQPNLGAKVLSSFPIPLPPIPEQHRITTKINQLFKKIDCAEQAYNELSGPLSERFRQLCLEKAVQGQLVPQLESEPEVEQVGDAPEDVPFEIPEKWRWMQLNKVGKIVGGGTPKTSLSEYWDGGTIPWFTPADLGKVHGLYASDSARKITALGLKESSAVMMPPNSVLFSSRAPIGHIALAADSCCTNQGCKSFVPNVGIVLPLWGYFAMKARTPDMIARASGTTFKEISGKGVGETLVPIPPLEEQRRIVTKLSEILNVVRQLENSVLIS